MANDVRVANVWRALVFRKGPAVSCLFVDRGTDIGPDRLYFFVLENTVPGRYLSFPLDNESAFERLKGS
jgi:hypothetical protein